MAQEMNTETGRDGGVYQIRLRGHLGRQWADWFEGLTVTLEENGETLLTGPLADQAALHGVLRKVRDMGLPLLAVNALPSDQDAPPHTAGGDVRHETRGIDEDPEIGGQR
jgi:hypothetical protein